MTATTEAKAIAAWIKVNTGLGSRDHHTKLKKAWREAPADARVPDAPPLGGKLLNQVREALAELETGASCAPKLGAADDPAMTPPPADGGWGDAPVCEDCKGTGRHMVAGNLCRCPLGERRKREEAAGVSSAPDEAKECDDMTTATKTKPKKTRKPTTGEPKPHDKEAEADLRKRYSKIEKVLEWSDSTGRPSRVRITCRWKHPGCEKTRGVFVQDLFQVHGCKPCAKVNMKLLRAESAKPAKKAKTKK